MLLSGENQEEYVEHFLCSVGLTKCIVAWICWIFLLGKYLIMLNNNRSLLLSQREENGGGQARCK